MKIKELLKSDKKHNPGIYILLLVGVLMLIFGSIPQKKQTESPEPSQAFNTDRYIESLEKKLEDTLSSIEGAGEVRVTLVARDRGSVDLGRDSSGEDKKTVVLSRQSGSEALVVAEKFPTVEGAVIVAQGAGSDKTKAALAEAVATALGIGMHKVKVYKLK